MQSSIGNQRIIHTSSHSHNSANTGMNPISGMNTTGNSNNGLLNTSGMDMTSTQSYTSLPLSRIKRICALDPRFHTISKENSSSSSSLTNGLKSGNSGLNSNKKQLKISTESSLALGISTELFLKYFVTHALEYTKKRRHPQKKGGGGGVLKYSDVASVVAEVEQLAFLADLVPMTVPLFKPVIGKRGMETKEMGCVIEEHERVDVDVEQEEKQGEQGDEGEQEDEGEGDEEMQDVSQSI